MKYGFILSFKNCQGRMLQTGGSDIYRLTGRAAGEYYTRFIKELNDEGDKLLKWEPI
jgi:hypothetical protein